MEITFPGVGESFAPDHPDTSLLINTTAAGERRQLLFDRGFGVPHLYFAQYDDPEQLDCLNRSR